MRRILLSSLIVLISVATCFSQSILWSENFEIDGRGIRYFPTSAFYDGPDDHFNRTDGQDINIISESYSGYEGSYFWAGEDHDDTGAPDNDGNPVKEINFPIVKTIGYKSLKFEGLFAAGHDGLSGASAYDDEDSLVVQISTDGGASFITALKFSATGDQSNEPIAFDSDFNGVGDSTMLGPLFQNFTFELPKADSVIVRVIASTNAGSEELAFDHFQISGEPDGNAPLPVIVSFLYSGDTILESSTTLHIPVIIENPKDSVAVKFNLSGDIKNIDFDKVIYAKASNDTVVILDFIIADDHFLNGVRKLDLSIEDVYSSGDNIIKAPENFLIYIIDDDRPHGGEIIISEIMYDSKSSSDQEWIELHNTTLSPINIGGWYLTDSDSFPATSEGDFIIPDETIIPPNGYRVISWEDLVDIDNELIVDKNTGYRNYAPGLVNGGDNLALFYSAADSVILVDGSLIKYYTDSSPANEGYSIERTKGGNYHDPWYASLNNYTGVEISKATPGEINSTYYTRIFFESSMILTSEDSLAYRVPVAIENPSDSMGTQVELVVTNNKGSVSAPRQLIFQPGMSATQLIDFDIIDDKEPGDIDSLTLILRQPSGGFNAFTVDSICQVVIHDNDFTRVSFKTDSIVINEGDTSKIQLDLINPHPINDVELTISSDTSELNFSDHIIISAGDSAIRIPIKALYDKRDEEDENFILRISNISGGNKAFVGEDSILHILLKDQKTERIFFEYDSLQIYEQDTLLELKIIRDNNDGKADTLLLKSSLLPEEIVIYPHDLDTLKLPVYFTENGLTDGDRNLQFTIDLLSMKAYSEIVAPSKFYLMIRDDDLPVKGDVVINEIMYDSKSSSDEEWVELYNTTTKTINISGWYLTDSDSFPASSEGDFVIPENTILPAGGYVVLAWKELYDFNEYVLINKTTGYRNSAPLLSNSGDNLMLFYINPDTSILIDGSDTVHYSAISPINGGVSIERMQNYEAPWSLSVNNFSGVEINKGTPGKVNSTEYTNISFATTEIVTSEDSVFFAILINISKPSDSTATSVLLKHLAGDTSQLEGFSEQEIIFHPSEYGSKPLYIRVRDDDQIGIIDTLLLQLSNPTGGNNAYIKDSIVQLVIKDNDFTSVGFTKDALTVKEGDTLKVELRVKNPYPGFPVVVNLKSSNDHQIKILEDEIVFQGQDTIHTTPILGVYDKVEEQDTIVHLYISESEGGNRIFLKDDSIVTIHIKNQPTTYYEFLNTSSEISESDGNFKLPVFCKNKSNTGDSLEIVAVGKYADEISFPEGNIISGNGNDTIWLEISIADNEFYNVDREVILELKMINSGLFSEVNSSKSSFALKIKEDEKLKKPLVINEILFDPPADTILGDANNDSARSSSDDEFIEIVNLDSLSVNLKGMIITDASGIRHVFEEAVLLQNSGIVVFGGGEPLGFNEFQTATSGGLSLNNGGDTIYVINNIDTITTAIYDGKFGKDQSITRDPEIYGSFVNHTDISSSSYSPGFMANGAGFESIKPKFHFHSTFVDSIIVVIYPNELNLNYILEAFFPSDSITISAGYPFIIKVNEGNPGSTFTFMPSKDSSETDISILLETFNRDTIISGQIFHIHKEDTFTITATLKMQMATPFIEISENEINFKSLLIGEEAVHSLDIKAISYDSLIISGNENLSFSTDSVNFSSTITLKSNLNLELYNKIYIKYIAEASGSEYIGDIIIRALTDTISIQSFAEVIKPWIHTTSRIIDFGVLLQDTFAQVSYPILAEGLIEDLEITAPEGYLLSGSSNFSGAENILVITPDLNGIVDTTIFVSYVPSQEGVFEGIINHTSAFAEKLELEVTGQFWAPQIEILKDTLFFGHWDVHSISAMNSYDLTGRSLVDTLYITSPPGFQISTREDNNFLNTIKVIPQKEPFNLSIFVRFIPDTAGIYNGTINHFTEGDSVFVQLNGISDAITAISTTDVDFTIYPNPADKILNIIGNTESEFHITIMDSKGLIFYKRSFFHARIIDIGKYPPGIYFLKLESDLGLAHQKIMVRH